MAWIQLRLSNYQQVAPLVRTGGSRHTGLAAPPHRNIQNEYCSSQPEINDPKFLMQLVKASESGQKVMLILELAKYRLNKKIPSNLSFEEKKSRLINSEEWNGWVYQHNKHLSVEELTEENIQNEINIVGECWGADIMNRFQKREWVQIAMNSNICKIYIP